MEQRPLASRFWPKVKKTDSCWLWTAKNNGKYGQVYVHGAGYRGAHRVSWQLHHGEFIPADMDICHHCDTPLCVRPDHLYLGTRKDNMQDAIKKGRLHHLKGSERAWAKLDEKRVVILRRLFYAGWKLDSLSRTFGIGESTAMAVGRGQKWKHVPMPRGVPMRPHHGGKLRPRPDLVSP
jgi:hypothetical protein